MPIIRVSDLRKEFKVYKRRLGFWGSVRGLFSREHTVVNAVDGIHFEIERGELVGYIGPNGAGKSTTIKMLTGILVPTSGRVEVRGLVPYEQRKENARRIGVVFGQRTQLWWDLPVIDSFELLKHIYRVPQAKYDENLGTFRELLNLDEFIETPVRKLSLGQRMRADIAASLLHDPHILYLDEPTIGLDVVAKEHIREFIREINQRRNVTVILTTHDLRDIEKLCQRIMIIDRGRILYDGSIDQVKERFGQTRTLVVDMANSPAEIRVPDAEVTSRDGGRVRLRFDRDRVTASDLIAEIIARYEIRDLTIEEPEIEDIVRRIYTETDLLKRET